MKRLRSLAWVFLSLPVHAQTACHTSMDQTYEWDNESTTWAGLPLRSMICPGEEPKDARWGGSIEIHVNRDDATVVEDTYRTVE